MIHPDQVLDDEDRNLLARLAAHRAHGPSESLYGRCDLCGLSWESERRAIELSRTTFEDGEAS